MISQDKLEFYYTAFLVLLADVLVSAMIWAVAVSYATYGPLPWATPVALVFNLFSYVVIVAALRRQ